MNTKVSGASPEVPDWLGPRRFALGLALVVLAAFPTVIVGTESFYFRDFGLFGYPLAHYHRDCFWRGEWPLWNPYNSLGLPFLAQWNTLALYPGSLIYLLLPLPWSLNLYCLTHLWLGGLGMYYLAKWWTRSSLGASLAGLTFALGGLMLSSLKWPNNIAVLGWMPWVIWLVERGWREGGRLMLTGSLVGALQMLAGTPELILMTWLMLTSLWGGQMVKSLWRGAVESGGRDVVRRAWRFPAMAGLVAGLSAAQLLPFFELLGDSQRGAQFGQGSWAMPWWGAANFLVPLFRCVRSHQGVFAQYGQYWVSSYYVGVTVVALAGFALWRARRPRVWFLAAGAGLSLVLAMGDAAGLYTALGRWLPGLGWMRFPVKFIVVAVLILPWLAAFGVAEWERQADTNSSTVGRFLGVTVLTTLGAIGLILVVASTWPMPFEDARMTLANGAARAGCFVVAALCLWGLARAGAPPTRGWCGLALLGLLAADNLGHGPWQNPVAPRWVMAPGLSELQPRPGLGQERAMLSPAAEHYLDHWMPPSPTQDYLASRLGLFCNCNLLDGVPKVNGFFSLYPRETSALLGALYHATNAYFPRVAAFLGVTQLTAEGRSMSWTPRTNALPWVTAGQAPIFAEPEATWQGLLSETFVPERQVYLPSEARGAVKATQATDAKITGSRWTAQSVEFVVRSSEPAWVVIAQSFARGWRATVDGQPTRLWRANQACQALEAPAGRHQVRLVYVDRAFQVGAALSLASLGVCLLLAARKS